MPIGRSWDLLTDADRHLVQERNRGRNFIDIKPEWEQISGTKVAESTLPNRYTRIMFNIAPFSAADDAALLDAKKEVEAVFEQQKWFMIADAASIAVTNTQRTWDAEQLKRRWQTLMDNGGRRPEVDLSSGDESSDAEDHAATLRVASTIPGQNFRASVITEHVSGHAGNRIDGSAHMQPPPTHRGASVSAQHMPDLPPYPYEQAINASMEVGWNPGYMPVHMSEMRNAIAWNSNSVHGASFSDGQSQARQGPVSRPGSSMGWANPAARMPFYDTTTSPMLAPSPLRAAHHRIDPKVPVVSPASLHTTSQSTVPTVSSPAMPGTDVSHSSDGRYLHSDGNATHASTSSTQEFDHAAQQTGETAPVEAA